MSLPSGFSIDVRGKLTENEPLGLLSWFRCGGDADLLFRPADLEDLISFLQQYSKDQPLAVLGDCANTIIRDGGIRGCVIQLDKDFSDIDVEGTKITAGAGCFNGTAASSAAKNGIGGLEFLSGIPGSVGGAVCMNAGAYGAEVKDVLVEAHGVDRQGGVHAFSPDDLKMRYRHSDIPQDCIITHAVFEGQLEERDVVRGRLKEIKEKRNTTQPIREQTGGSTFANPSAEDLKAVGLPEDMRAWQVVEKVGGRGLMVGGAKMSEQHCNFMINAGEATASDLEALGDELIARAQDQLGLTLHWEIKRVGER